MFKIKNKLHLLLYFPLFFLFGCKSTKVDDTNIPPIPYIINEDVAFDSKQENSKYIFLRLYNPNYSNPLYIANLLKNGIELTDVTNFELSHASINFSLEDDFYGLTINGPKQFEKESCTDIENNNYMNRCNPHTSEQFTFALRVTEEEYENTKKMVEQYYELGDIRYNTSDNFLMALFLTKKKFFTRKKERTFGNMKYPRSILNEKKAKDPNYIENDFLCCTFIAYILLKNIPEINDWFQEHNINYNYINVTDIPFIPGVVPLFYSTWDNYSIAASLFTEQYPEFKTYLNN